MEICVGILGIILILVVLQDGFETIVLPRRVIRRYRFARLFYMSTWKPWSALAKKIKSTDRREYMLSFFGPLSLLMLLVSWGGMMIFGFALAQWGLGSHVQAVDRSVSFTTDLYFSGVTFFTLGYGDVIPISPIARVLAVTETGLGFAFLALVIGYVPVIYQSFSRRESSISLMDAHAGSPPSAGELLRRHSQEREELSEHLHEWEIWCAELLESHLSYPVLMYYRSQHDNQSWLATLTTILDVCALGMIGIDDVSSQTAGFTFAIARHAAVDLSQTFEIQPDKACHPHDRLSPQGFQELKQILLEAGFDMHDEETAEQRLAEIRALYEPYIIPLSKLMMMSLSEWYSKDQGKDDWQTSAWDHSPKNLIALESRRKRVKEHHAR